MSLPKEAECYGCAKWGPVRWVRDGFAMLALRRKCLARAEKLAAKVRGEEAAR